MSQSRLTQTYTVRDSDLNQYGIMHGGRLLTLCDDCAYLSAKKLTHHICLTRAVHRTQFHRTVHQDEKIILSTVVGLTGKTSLWVAVEVTSVLDNAAIMDAVFVFVALNEKRQPQQVVNVWAETSAEILLQDRLIALRNQVRSKS